MNFGDLLRREDYGTLCRLIGSRLMVRVDPGQLRRAVQLHVFLHTRQEKLRYEGQDEAAHVWLKCRLDEMGLLRAGR